MSPPASASGPHYFARAAAVQASLWLDPVSGWASNVEFDASGDFTYVSRLPECRMRDHAGPVRDGPDPPCPRVVAREQRGGGVGVVRRDDRAEPAAHVEHLPHLGGVDVAAGGDQVEDRGHGEGVGDVEPDVRVEAQEV